MIEIDDFLVLLSSLFPSSLTPQFSFEIPSKTQIIIVRQPYYFKTDQ